VCYQFADDTQLLVGIDSTNVRTLHSAAVNFEAHLKVAIGQFPILAEPSYAAWRALAEIVLARLVVFNKRRGGEPAKMILSQFVNRPD